MIRKILSFVLIVILVGVLYFIASKRSSVCKNCNILFISLDTLAATHLPCYGYERNTSPKLCAFADKNVRFSRAYAQTYWTLPSHFSMFTGLYPSTHRMLEEYGEPLNVQYKTLTEILKNAGYHTQFIATPTHSTLPMDKGFERGFEEIIDQPNYTQADWDSAIGAFIASTKKGKTFTFIHTYYTHAPYFPGNKEKLRFAGTVNAGIPISDEQFDSTENLLQYFSFLKKWFVKNNFSAVIPEHIQDSYIRFMNSDSFEDMKKNYYGMLSLGVGINDVKTAYLNDIVYEKDINFTKDLYDELIADLDTMVFSSLERIAKELPDNTIVIVTSDHGEAFKEHKTIGHSNLYSEILRVPLVMKIPGKNHIVLDQFIQGIDLYPTLLDMVGIHYIPERIEGKSMACLTDCPKEAFHPYIISEKFKEKKWSFALTTKNDTFFADGMIGNAKGFESVELFDMEHDVGQQKDISTSHVDVVKDKLLSIRSFILRGKVQISITPVPTHSQEVKLKEQKDKLKYFHY